MAEGLAEPRADALAEGLAEPRADALAEGLAEALADRLPLAGLGVLRELIILDEAFVQRIVEIECT